MIQKTHRVLKKPEYNRRSRISPIRTNGDIKNLKDRKPWTVRCLQNITIQRSSKGSFDHLLKFTHGKIEET